MTTVFPGGLDVFSTKVDRGIVYHTDVNNLQDAVVALETYTQGIGANGLGVYNPMSNDFGAVGDGVSDDSTPINNTFAALPAEGGTVWFPPGHVYYAPSIDPITQNNVQIFLNGSTLKGQLNITGDDVVLDLGGGTINGLMIYTSIHPAVAIGATAITVTDASEFNTSETVQSSYGLGTDGLNPRAITSVVGNTINVAAPDAPTILLPDLSYVGNWVWSYTVRIAGDRGLVRNGNITRSKGIGLGLHSGADLLAENLYITESGLETMEIRDANVTVNNVHLGDIIDAAKQSVGIDGQSTAVFNQCEWQPRSYDNAFYINNSDDDVSSITCNHCKFNLIGGVSVAPYSANGVLCYMYKGNAPLIAFNNCEIYNYRFGTYTDVESGASATITRYILKDCYFHDGFAPDKWYLAGHNPTFSHVIGCYFKTLSDFYAPVHNFVNCQFDSCAFDASTYFQGRMVGCNFNSSTGIRFASTSFLDACYFFSTQIGTYPYSGTSNLRGILNMGLCFFNHSDFPVGTLGNVVSLPANTTQHGHLQDINSSLKVRFLSTHAGLVTFKVESNHNWLAYPFELRNKDYYIPLGSRFTNWDDGTQVRVNKSNVTTLNGAVIATAVTIVVTSAAGMASGDVINIRCDDGRVHVTTINGAPAGTTITLTVAMPAAAASGLGVCSYTYV